MTKNKKLAYLRAYTAYLSTQESTHHNVKLMQDATEEILQLLKEDI